MAYSDMTHVILIDGEVRTRDVSLVQHDIDDKKIINIYFKNDTQKLYQYSVDNVVVLDEPRIFNPDEYSFYFEGNNLEDVYIACKFSGKKGLCYWTFGFTNDSPNLVSEAFKIRIEKKKNIPAKSTDMLSFLKKIAYFEGYGLVKDANLLGKYFSNLRPLEHASLVRAFLSPDGFDNDRESLCRVPIFPFGTNTSQLNAVQEALTHRISIIQGPPGTGKTQTILNIIANLVVGGKTVMAIAGSGSATDNIIEQLQEAGLGFIAARLGSNRSKADFIKNKQGFTPCPEPTKTESFETIAELTEKLIPLYEKDLLLHKYIAEGEAQKVSKLSEQIDRKSFDSLKQQLSEYSMDILRHCARERCCVGKQRTAFELSDIDENASDFDKFLEFYPVVVSTAYSASISAGSDSVYDYLIVDEASSIGLTQGILSMSIAKNIVVVGDVKQLPNVIVDCQKAVFNALFSFYDLPERCNFATHNFLQSICATFPQAPETMLREHYRCHPKIARFFNDAFYGGELVPMREDHGEKDVLILKTTVPGNHSFGCINHREEEEIEEVKREFNLIGDKLDLGIVTPYRNQVKRIKGDEDIEDNLLVYTVHGFQGRQRDSIIFSTVDNQYGKFLNDPQLVNVSVSRAKNHLIVVTNGNNGNTGIVQRLVKYIRDNDGTILKGTVHSLFDMVYKQNHNEYNQYMRTHPKLPSNNLAERPTKAEKIAYGFITDVLRDYPILGVSFRHSLKTLIPKVNILSNEELEFASKEGAHIDFLLYDKITAQNILAIEIDGHTYHREGSIQDKRDKLKNHILELIGIPMLRFKTKESINEEETLREKIEKTIRLQENVSR